MDYYLLTDLAARVGYHLALSGAETFRVEETIRRIIGAYGTAYIGHILPPDDLTLGLQHSFNAWFMWMSIIKSLFFAFIIASVSSFFGYTVEGGSVEVGKASTDAVVSSSVLILFSDVFLTQILS